ncbi:MAG: ATP-binding cassette domain-containing protein [Actinomycetota bacterium]|nr:ATP-binding cassette domain-containing protein [Actinomycetota bacterium]
MTATRGQQLQIEGLNKRYGDTVALQDMSFEVQPGELFGFVGSNGAGKTTTMRIALGVLSADSGHVHLGGQPIDLALRRRIGYMPEERGLYPKMKVGPQLSYLAQLHGLSTGDAADAVTAWTTRLGIDTRMNDTVDALSLGNQQRVQLAAALVHDPDVLVLDEPFSGLDPVAVDVMSDVLAEKAADGVPVIFSSHQLDLVERLCHRVGIVVGGHMQECGSVDQLRARGRTQLTVHAPQAPPGWADELPGVHTVRHDDTHTVLALDPDVDDQAVLAAALRTGPVHEFARSRPTLTELFREVVAA